MLGLSDLNGGVLSEELPVLLVDPRHFLCCPSILFLKHHFEIGVQQAMVQVEENHLWVVYLVAVEGLVADLEPQR